MNLRTVSIVVLGVLLLTGIGTFALDGGSDAPFELNNSTLPEAEEPINSSQGVDNNRLTEEAVTFSTLHLSQKSFRLQVTTDEQGETITENVLYTPSKAYKSVVEDEKIIYEYFYTAEYTASYEHAENSSSYDLRDPRANVETHLKEDSLRALVSGVTLTSVRTETRSGMNYTIYSGDSLNGDGANIASAFGVDSVERIQSVEVIRNEDRGYISSASVEMVVENNNAQYTLTREYTLTIDRDIDIQEQPWVQEALQQNAGIDSFILSNSMVRLQHKYGVTLNSGDTIQVITPTGNEYKATLQSTFGPGDSAVLIHQDEQLQVVVNPDDSVSGQQEFAQTSGRYTIIFITENGVVEVTTQVQE